jgi:hypothetical protein
MSSAETTQNVGSKNYTIVAAVLMVALLAYGVLTLLDVIR